MTKQFRLPFLLIVALGIITLVGCRLINPSGSDSESVIPAVSQSLVIPVVLPSTEVVTTGLTKLALRGNADMSKDLDIHVIINGASQSMGLPMYYADHPSDTTKKIVFFAKTAAELGITDSSTVGSFTMVLQGGEEITVPAGKLADLLVTVSQIYKIEDVVAGVAKAMGVVNVPTNQGIPPTIKSTIPRLTLTRNAKGQIEMTTEKIAISNGTSVTEQQMGNPGITLPAPKLVASSMKAKAGMEYTALQELIKLVSATRGEDGCISYDLFQGNNGTFASQGVATQTTGFFVLRENWKNQAAIDAHSKTAHFADFWSKANILFETPVGEAGPFRVTFAIDPARSENPGTIGYQRVALVSANSTFETEKGNFLAIIHNIRNRPQNFIGYESFQADGITAGTATSSLIIWERFIKPTDGSSLWTPVEDFLKNSLYTVDLINIFSKTLDMRKIWGSYLDPVYCPPNANLKINTGLKASLLPLPKVWPGF